MILPRQAADYELQLLQVYRLLPYMYCKRSQLDPGVGQKMPGPVRCEYAAQLGLRLESDFSLPPAEHNRIRKKLAGHPAIRGRGTIYSGKDNAEAPL